MIKISREYKMRVECQQDADVIRARLQPWVQRWQVLECHETRDDGTTYWTPDVEVEFTIAPGGPTKGELKWLIDSIVDCSIAAESLDGMAEYTGDRYPLDESDCIVTQPSVQVLKKSRRAVRKYREYLEATIERVTDDLDSQFQTLCCSGAVAARETRRDARFRRPAQH